jgi:hypothetical protein
MKILSWLASIFLKSPDDPINITYQDNFGLTSAAYFKDKASLVPMGTRFNASNLLSAVRCLLCEIGWKGNVIVTSGYRELEHNLEIGGKPHSLHMVGKAIDLADPGHWIIRSILKQPDLLKKYGLWMESPAHTPKHIHLDMGKRPEREIRVFNP